MEKSKIILGAILLLLGVSYLYHPNVILKINDWARKYVFNDSTILLNRRKRGLFFLLLALVVILSGLRAFGSSIPPDFPTHAFTSR